MCFLEVKKEQSTIVFFIQQRSCRQPKSLSTSDQDLLSFPRIQGSVIYISTPLTYSLCFLVFHMTEILLTTKDSSLLILKTSKPSPGLKALPYLNTLDEFSLLSDEADIAGDKKQAVAMATGYLEPLTSDNQVRKQVGLADVASLVSQKDRMKALGVLPNRWFRLLRIDKKCMYISSKMQ